MATASFQRAPGALLATVDAHLGEPRIGAIGGGGASASGGGVATARAARATGGAAARVAIELTRCAGRSSASLTRATMTGVIAVANTVPACQSLETTVAATTEAIAASDQRVQR